MIRRIANTIDLRNLGRFQSKRAHRSGKALQREKQGQVDNLVLQRGDNGGLIETVIFIVLKIVSYHLWDKNCADS